MSDKSPDGYIVGFSLFGVLQLLRMERTSCLVYVEGGDGQVGTMAFANGVLLHAACGALCGEDAVFELLGWDDAQVSLREGDPGQPRTISKPLTELLIAAIYRQDEVAAASPLAVTEELVDTPEAPLPVTVELVEVDDDARRHVTSWLLPDPDSDFPGSGLLSPLWPDPDPGAEKPSRAAGRSS